MNQLSNLIIERIIYDSAAGGGMEQLNEFRNKLAQMFYDIFPDKGFAADLATELCERAIEQISNMSAQDRVAAAIRVAAMG